MTAAVKALGGEWDTRRAVTALADAGHQVAPSRAREMLRRLCRAGLLIRTHPVRAEYRAADPE